MLDTRVKDWTTEQHDAPVELSYRSLWLSWGLFFAGAAAVWLALYGLSKALPYVHNGAEVVAEIKWARASSPGIFAPTDRIKIVAFGNSKTLAGFRPSVVAAAIGPNVGAYNLAIPGDSRFLNVLETALAHGDVPTHVFVQILPRWSAKEDSLWNTLLDNKKMVNLLFPFRNFVRDAIIFAYESRKLGGVAAQYKSNAAQVRQVKDERGYYFIKSQSHYPGDRLPDGYALPTDRPDDVFMREIDPADPQFERLMRLADKYDFQVMFVPIAYRQGEFAEPPAVDANAVRLLAAYPRVHVIGPAYWLYELKDFSDPLHLNIGGAERYSRQLGGLFKDWLASRH